MDETQGGNEGGPRGLEGAMDETERGKSRGLEGAMDETQRGE